MHAVVTALHTQVDAALTKPVYDGPRPTSAADPDYVLIGSTGDDGDDAATNDLSLSSLGPGTWTDHDGEIVGSVWSVTGGTDMTACRAAAQATFDAVKAAIDADRTLGGVLKMPGLARVSRAALRQQQTSEGAVCRIAFTVTYQHTSTT